jgi:hypothetical protein
MKVISIIVHVFENNEVQSALSYTVGQSSSYGIFSMQDQRRRVVKTRKEDCPNHLSAC